MFKKFNIYIKNSIIKYFNMLDEKNYYKKHYAHITMKIFVSQVFPRALPLRLGESTFTVPRPSLKPSQKRALCKLYIYRKGETFLGSFLRPFSVCGKTSAQSRRHFVESHKVPHSGSLCDLLILIPPADVALSV